MAFARAQPILRLRTRHDIVRTNSLYPRKICTSCPGLAHRGASSGDVRLAERGAAPAGRARNLALGRPGAPPGGHYGPPAESRLTRPAHAVLESAARVRKEAA